MIQLPNTISLADVADWIEIHLATEARSISKVDLASTIEMASGEEPSEGFLSSVWIEMAGRQAMYNNPPFSVMERRIEKVDEEVTPFLYIACLILSLFGASGTRLSASKLFERLAAVVIKEYLQGEVFVFGWPVLQGVETAIGDRMKQLTDLLNETFVESPATPYKDRGVDVIGWKSFGESRSSQFAILAQCASGINWRNKTTDLPLASWTQYIHWACDPIKAFVVPCIIPGDLWHDVSREAGILFDRIRIVNLLSDVSIDAALNEEFEQWVKEQLEEISLD